MTYIINDKLSKLIPYEPEVGKYQVRLDANESFLNLPAQIMQEIQIKIKDLNFNRYPDPLATSCINGFAKYHGLNPDQVTAGNGSDELINVIMAGFFQKGDKILLLDPDFAMYNIYAHTAELKVVKLNKPASYEINIDDVIQTVINNQCSGLLFSNPCNPTSLSITRKQAIKLLDSLQSTLIIIDEAYMDFWHESVIDLVNKYTNLLVLRTCSKSFGLAAMRLGFAVACKPISQALRALKSPYNVNSLTQEIGKIILDHPICIKQALDKLIKSRNELSEDLLHIQSSLRYKKLGLVNILESSTNFITVTFKDNLEIYNMLKKQGILVRYFPGFLRITAGNYLENQSIVECLKKYGEG